MFGCGWLKGGLVWMSPSGRKTIPNGWDSTCGLEEPSILKQSAASQAFERIKACTSLECLWHLVKLLLWTGIGSWFYDLPVQHPLGPGTGFSSQNFRCMGHTWKRWSTLHFYIHFWPNALYTQQSWMARTTFRVGAGFSADTGLWAWRPQCFQHPRTSTAWSFWKSCHGCRSRTDINKSCHFVTTLSQKWMPFIYKCDPTKPRQKNIMVVFILLMKIFWPKGSQIWTCTFFQLRPWWDHACKFPFLQKEMLVKHASCRMVSWPKKNGLYAIQKSCSFSKARLWVPGFLPSKKPS